MKENPAFASVFDSLANVAKGTEATLVPIPSSEGDLRQLINDHIFGLLHQGTLTQSQVTLLAALLKTRGNLCQ